MSSPVPLPLEGRLAIVTDVGSGMRWACWRARRAWPVRTAKSCGPDPPTLGSSLCVTNAQATVAKKPGTPGRARDTPSNHCAGNAGCFGVPVVTAACFFCCRRAMGAASTRHSLCPLLREGRDRCITRAFRAAGMRTLVSFVVARSVSDDVSAVAQRAKAEAIQTTSAETVWIASWTLSSGRASRGPVGSQ